MTSVTASPAETRTAHDPRDAMKALHALTACLASWGYAEFWSTLDPLAPRLMKGNLHRSDAPRELIPLLDLFLLGNPVSAPLVSATLGDLVQDLVEAGILVRTETDILQTPQLVLLPIVGYWLFCEKQKVNPTMYYGDDSVALLMRLRPRMDGVALDLCAGPGIQSLQCSNFARKVVAVEINPIAMQLARLNVAMNEREDRIHVRCGNLYDAVPGERFDTIVANPPLLPIPQDMDYPFVGHGGSDGMDLTWKILDGLPEFLAEEGTAQIIGTCLSDGTSPLPLARLEQWCQRTSMDVLMTIPSHNPLRSGDEFFEGLIDTAASAGNIQRGELVSKFAASLARQNANHLCAYFLHVVRRRGKLRVQDLSQKNVRGLWYV